MANMIDYLDWRGDLTLEQDPFNEVDNLLLSYLSYVNLDGVAPQIGEGDSTIQEVTEAFFEAHTEEELARDKSFIRLAPQVMKRLGETERFAQAKICNYVNHIDPAKEVQFSALEILLEDGTSFVSYRGTDDTIVGWKEDFRLCNGVVPAEREATNYLNLVGQSRSALRVGGHSKGGNLAIYAAVGCEPEIQEKIQSVYNNDGPGFAEDILDSGRLKAILPRIVRIVPESSIIGMLLEHPAKPRIIRSSQKGPLQHDGFSWQILGNTFVRVEELSATGKLFDETLRSWIGALTMEQRDAFIDAFFSVLEASNCETLTELQNGGIKNVGLMVRQLEKLDPSVKQRVEELLRLLFSNWTDQVRASLGHT